RAGADVLYLQSGEALSGSLHRVGSGVVVFKTSLAGRVIVPVDQVRGLSTSSSYLVTFADRDSVAGRFFQEDGKTFVRPDVGEVAQRIDLTTVVGLSAAPERSFSLS
ncbi:MAG: hypothetical protein ACE5EO_09340, partial [Candidatus Krumholzibacteriia bacterium]